MKNITEIKETLSDALKHKTAFNDTDLIASVLIDVICECFNGDMVYIPNHKKSVTRAKIRAKFNGHNHSELAKEFDYSVMGIRTILKNENPAQKTAF